MPIRRLAITLAFVAVITFAVGGGSRANPFSGFAKMVTTFVDTSSTTLNRAIFRFVTSHKQPKPRDTIKIQVLGLSLNAGDELALHLLDDPATSTNVVRIGDPETNDVLILDSRLKASGQLGVFPNDFTLCKAVYNLNSQRLNLFCKKGTAVQVPIDFSAAGGATKFTRNMTVRVWVNGDAADYPATFEIRFSNRPQGPLTERGYLEN